MFEEVGIDDVPSVGGKNASLGEMYRKLSSQGVRVPNGFAVTAAAYRHMLDQADVWPRLHQALDGLVPDDVADLERRAKIARELVYGAGLPRDLQQAIRAGYRQLVEQYGEGLSLAVRSSATAEDLPDASFAGQQETFLNVRGEDGLLDACRRCFASLFTDRAIHYRVDKGFDHFKVGLSIGVMKMVRSDIAASGVMFTLDTESGFRDVVFINAAYGLGENVVQGAVDPDELSVHKPTFAAGHRAVLRRRLGDKAVKMILVEEDARHTTRNVPTSDDERGRFCITDDDAMELTRCALAIEAHYRRPMDIEWAKDGVDGKIYIVQARPETVASQRRPTNIDSYVLDGRGKVLAEGRAVGERIATGRMRLISDVSQLSTFQPGEILVADTTTPDWEPVMKTAAAIVTNRGGRTCHAAIIARELGVPAVVGTGDALQKIPDGRAVTVSCAEGDTGFIYDGKLKFERITADLGDMPPAPLKIMMNVANPERAFDFGMLPNQGIGLARLEMIIASHIGVHPKALLQYEQQDAETKAKIDERVAGYAGPVEFYVDRLAEGIATIAASVYPKTVIVRMSDFKSNEYANLLGGGKYEPHEENPMIGFRGASRYVDDSFAEAFGLECKAVKKVREAMGLDNVWVMIPFVRTLDEGRKVVDVLKANGLKQGESINGNEALKVIMMCEVPSNALLAEEFLDIFDGFSIGSNDLTQLTLGLDRDSSIVASLFDERNPAVKKLLSMAIQTARAKGKYVGICGQGPSDHADLAEWLMDQGIESVSLNPDTVVDTWLRLAKHKG